MTVAEPRPAGLSLRGLLLLLVIAGAPLVALLVQRADGPAGLDLVVGPVLAIGMMSIAMMAAALAGRLWIGMALGIVAGAGLWLLMRGLGMPAVPHPLSAALAMAIASTSFAARGALFAGAHGRRGWWLAVCVVGGEAAMLVTASALPGWLLLLLPAQWASTALQTAITGSGTKAAAAALIALAGTAATTMLVTRLLPRRWPYGLMFTGWLICSALVWQWPGPPVARAELFPAAVAWLAGKGD